MGEFCMKAEKVIINIVIISFLIITTSACVANIACVESESEFLKIFAIINIFALSLSLFVGNIIHRKNN